jgi:hypothetical protein
MPPRLRPPDLKSDSKDLVQRSRRQRGLANAEKCPQRPSPPLQIILRGSRRVQSTPRSEKNSLWDGLYLDRCGHWRINRHRLGQMPVADSEEIAQGEHGPQLAPERIVTAQAGCDVAEILLHLADLPRLMR